MTTVHLLCPVHNGAPFLPEFLGSLQAQTHQAWKLWLVDDASQDASVPLLEQAVANDARMHLLTGPPHRLGAVGAFAWLWTQLPADARYIAFADQDDLWAPNKLALTLAAVQKAEGDGRRPILVHTDLEVVGPALEPIAPSFWRHSDMVPEPATLRRLAAQNVVTGCTTLFNRALYDAVGTIPPEATMHDAWVAAVATMVGEVIALPTPTVRYRQHGGNAVGARPASSTLPLWPWLQRLWRAFTGPNRVRPQIYASARQAGLLLQQYGHLLQAADRDFLRRYAQIPRMSWWQRKGAVARLHLHPEHHWLRNAGVLWRA